MQEIIKYITHFLVGEHLPQKTASYIGYTSNEKEFDKYKIVIIPSDFFSEEIYNTPQSLPKLPLKIWEETPILFGSASTELINSTYVIKADLIASTFFLISRYEEVIRADVRDNHHRFPGKESLPYRAGFIDRPLIDEYGKIIRNLLREVGCKAPEPPQKINKIYLTHDVDYLAHFRNIRGLIGGLLRGFNRPKIAKKAFRSYFGKLKNDPWYTFPFLFRLDKSLLAKWGESRCETICFIRSAGKNYKEDKPFPNLLNPDYKRFIKSCKRNGVKLGLHSSYESGVHPELIENEKQKLERFSKVKISYNRNHFLNTREPKDMQALIDAGITDDFSLGYADMAGFRLGTCRAVRWINLEKMELSNLKLHSLNIMDRSLDDKRYMYMNAHDAYQFCTQLIDIVSTFNGEICLLWHNNLVENLPGNYHRKLYQDLIKYLKSK